MKPKKIAIIGMPLSGKSSVLKELRKSSAAGLDAEGPDAGPAAGLATEPAPMLAEWLDGFKFVDADALIAKKHGPIDRIFKDRGAEFFRKAELDLLLFLTESKDPVIAAFGGGIAETPEAVRVLEDRWQVNLLDLKITDLLKRLTDSEISKRPLLQADSDTTEQKLRELYKRRMPIYRGVAGRLHDACKPPAQLAAEIVAAGSRWGK